MAEKIMSSKKDFQNAIKALPSASLEDGNKFDQDKYLYEEINTKIKI